PAASAASTTRGGRAGRLGRIETSSDRLLGPTSYSQTGANGSRSPALRTFSRFSRVGGLWRAGRASQGPARARRAGPALHGGRHITRRSDRSASVTSHTATAPAPEIGIATRTLGSPAPAVPTVPRGRPTAMPPLRLLLAWALGSFIVGSIVAA